MLADYEYSIKTRGYSLVKNFLKKDLRKELVQILVENLRSYEAVVGSKRSLLDKNQLHDLMLNEKYLKLLEDTRLQALLEPFLGPHWIMYAATSSSIPPGSKNYSNRIHVDSPRFSRDYIFNMGVIWTLSDYTAENGAIEVLPGSHNLDQEPSEDYFKANSEKIMCEAGDLIVFNARLWHRTGINKSPDWRHAMTLNACRAFMKQRLDWPRMLPANSIEMLSEQAKRIIGMNSRVPSSLAELFVPEEKRLYKPNQG
jgi:ectoine hydroxylase-related dioxygenase (phytanoyl-CoA dioxygenase family)